MPKRRVPKSKFKKINLEYDDETDESNSSEEEDIPAGTAQKLCQLDHYSLWLQHLFERHYIMKSKKCYIKGLKDVVTPLKEALATIIPYYSADLQTEVPKNMPPIPPMQIPYERVNDEECAKLARHVQRCVDSMSKLVNSLIRTRGKGKDRIPGASEWKHLISEEAFLQTLSAFRKHYRDNRFAIVTIVAENSHGKKKQTTYTEKNTEIPGGMKHSTSSVTIHYN